jgi:hypothetical protein
VRRAAVDHRRGRHRLDRQREREQPDDHGTHAATDLDGSHEASLSHAIANVTVDAIGTGPARRSAEFVRGSIKVGVRLPITKVRRASGSRIRAKARADRALRRSAR